MPLNKKQKNFCKYKAQGYSNKESAIKAGYAKTTAKTKAHLWLDKSEIKAEIKRLQEITKSVSDEKFGINQEWIVAKIKRVIDTADCEQDFNAQLKGLDMLGKISGIYERDNSQKNNLANLINAAAKIKEALND